MHILKLLFMMFILVPFSLIFSQMNIDVVSLGSLASEASANAEASRVKMYIQHFKKSAEKNFATENLAFRETDSIDASPTTSLMIFVDPCKGTYGRHEAKPECTGISDEEIANALRRVNGKKVMIVMDRSATPFLKDEDKDIYTNTIMKFQNKLNVLKERNGLKEAHISDISNMLGGVDALKSATTTLERGLDIMSAASKAKEEKWKNDQLKQMAEGVMAALKKLKAPSCEYEESLVPITSVEESLTRIKKISGTDLKDTAICIDFDGTLAQTRRPSVESIQKILDEKKSVNECLKGVDALYLDSKSIQKPTKEYVSVESSKKIGKLVQTLKEKGADVYICTHGKCDDNPSKQEVMRSFGLECISCRTDNFLGNKVSYLNKKLQDEQKTKKALILIDNSGETGEDFIKKNKLEDNSKRFAFSLLDRKDYTDENSSDLAKQNICNYFTQQKLNGVGECLCRELGKTAIVE